jgi:hypothetical protein
MRTPGDSGPKQPGGGAAKRLQEFLKARSPKGVVSPPAEADKQPKPDDANAGESEKK